MNWKLLFLALGLAAAGLCALAPGLLDPASVRAPWEGGLAYVYPSFATPDDDGAVYTIDRSLRRITKVDAGGMLRYRITGGSRGAGSFFYAAELAVHRDGRLFVLNTVLGPEGFATEREEILVYDADGRFLATVYSKTYRPEEITNNNATRGRWLGLTVGERSLSWYELTDAGVVESSLDLGTWRLNQDLALDIPWSARYVASVARLDAERLAYVTKAGEIWSKRPGTEPVLLYAGDDHADGGLSVPWWIGASGAGGLIYTDLTRGSFGRLASDGSASSLVSPADIEAFTGDPYPYVYYSFGRSMGGDSCAVNDLGVLRFSGDGTVEAYVTGGRYPIGSRLLSWVFWLGVLVELAALVLGARWIRVWLLKRRTILAFKQLLVILPIVILVMASFTWALIGYLYQKVQDRSFEQLSQMAQGMAMGLDTDALAGVRTQRDFYSPAYDRLRSYLHATLNDNRDPWNRHLYFALHHIRDGKIYTMMYLNDGTGVFHPFTYLNDPQGLYWQAVRAGISTVATEDAWGSWLLAVGPVRDRAGQVVALVEVGQDMFGYNQELRRDLESMVPLALGGFGVLILAFVGFTWFFLKPLRTLKKGVASISEGRWDTELQIRGHDEVADLTLAFNRMTKYIRDYIQEIMALSQGYRRFVPQQFLTHLNKQDVTEVVLGDQTQREMTVLFSDIRSFTRISESMSPKENFDFLNSYLGLVGPEVRKNNGFIDKYIGDAIMALYPEKADDALQTAISINLTLVRFNRQQKEQGRPLIKVGIGIHTGTLMLGILGEPERFDGSVISDNVNLASRIEGLTKTFDAAILISDTTMARLADPDRYTYRYLGKVQVKGKLEPIGLYEILDGIPDAAKAAKMASKRPLEAGVAAYQAADFETASKHFYQAMKENQGDVPARMYLSLLKKREGQETAADWNGAIVMNTK